MIVIGAVIAAFMFFGADLLANLIGNPNSALSIRVLAVTAFCAFVMSAPLSMEYPSHL